MRTIPITNGIPIIHAIIDPSKTYPSINLAKTSIIAVHKVTAAEVACKY